MEQLLQDLRFGAKALWKDHGFTGAALLTLALCLGVNAAIFSVVDSVLLQPLDIPEPEQVALVFNSYPNAGADRASNGVPDFYDRLEHVPAFEELALWQNRGVTFGGAGETPERLPATAVTPSFFDLLRTEPAFGRLFQEEDGKVGQEQVVVLSHGLWQDVFGGRDDVVGQEVFLTERPYQVVGVLPEGFLFLDRDSRIFTPLAFSDEERSDERRHSNNYQMIGRLAPGATLEQAQGQIDALNAANLERFPNFREPLINAGFHTRVVSLQEDVVREVRSTLFLLWGGALFVLLIGAVNVANLALVRASGRTKELSIRAALGARRGRVLRLLLAESFLLAGLGGLAGLGLGALCLRALPALGLDGFPRGSEIALGGTVVAVIAALTVAIGLLLALLPALQLRKADSFATLREEGRSGTTGRSTRRLRQGLVVAQVAFAFLLLIGAGLLLASFQQVLQVDPGFDGEGVLTAGLALPGSRYDSEEAVVHFQQRLLDSLATIPGVQSAALTSTIPFGDDFSDSVIFAEGYEMAPGESVISPSQVVVSPDYFQALGIPLLSGRTFDSRDREGARRAIIVDERLANRFWPGQDAVGKRMFMPGSAEDLMNPGPEEDRFTVVGVVGEIKIRTRVPTQEPVGAYYLPFTQQVRSRMVIALKTTGDPNALTGSLRSELAAEDPQLPLYAVQPMATLMEDDLVPRRSPMVLALAFAGLALLLAAVGLYGTLAYLVSQRSREMGIRLALGSTGARIRRLVLGEGLAILSIGLGLGLAGALAFGRALESQLYGVTALDPVVLTQVAVVLAAVSLLACWLPAARASRTDPIRALSLD